MSIETFPADLPLDFCFLPHDDVDYPELICCAMLSMDDFKGFCREHLFNC